MVTYSLVLPAASILSSTNFLCKALRFFFIYLVSFEAAPRGKRQKRWNNGPNHQHHQRCSNLQRWHASRDKPWRCAWPRWLVQGKTRESRSAGREGHERQLNSVCPLCPFSPSHIKVLVSSSGETTAAVVGGDEENRPEWTVWALHCFPYVH